MKSKSNKRTWRWKMAGLAALFLAAGTALIYLSSLTLRPLEGGGGDGVAASAPAASAPTGEAPATAPAEEVPGRGGPIDPRKAATENMSGMLLLLGLVGIGFGVICAGWVAYDLYRSRPAWKTQTRYPVRRPRR